MKKSASRFTKSKPTRPSIPFKQEKSTHNTEPFDIWIRNKKDENYVN